MDFDCGIMAWEINMRLLGLFQGALNIVNFYFCLGDTKVMRYNLWFVCSYGLFEKFEKTERLFCYVLMQMSQMFLVKSSGEIKMETSETIVDNERIEHYKDIINLMWIADHIEIFNCRLILLHICP